jgi:anthranilate synthase/aminodeoxychorismate synthase-like glutamine amidotransferase
MLLLLDNYDSFTYNLAQYFGELGCELLVRRNDSIALDEISALAPDHICISPGPGAPDDAAISKALIAGFTGQVPILGVCLGHQCIAEVFGGKVLGNWRLMHGKASAIYHNGDPIFSGLPTPFQAARYHSLAVEAESLPSCLQVIAQTEEREIMALRHRDFPTYGVQFHPESVLTPEGKRILSNFLKLPRSAPRATTT